MKPALKRGASGTNHVCFTEISDFSACQIAVWRKERVGDPGSVSVSSVSVFPPRQTQDECRKNDTEEKMVKLKAKLEICKPGKLWLAGCVLPVKLFSCVLISGGLSSA